MGFVSFLFLSLGLLYYSFQRSSSKCFTTQLDCGLRFKSLRVLGFFFVFSLLQLGVFSFVQFSFLWEGPLILLLFSSLSVVSLLSLVSFLLLIYFSSFLIEKNYALGISQKQIRNLEQRTEDVFFCFEDWHVHMYVYRKGEKKREKTHKRHALCACHNLKPAENHPNAP